MMMRVSVVGGAGYVGLVTGLGLAALGHDVVNVDIDVGRIEQLQAGRSPIYEEAIEDLLARCRSEARIAFTTRLADAVAHGDVIFIAVGTPSRLDGQADLSQVIEVAEQLLDLLDGYKLIIVKSTVPVGTVELIRSILSRRRREGKDFDIVVNPEFLREGKGLHDFFHPDRIVIGSESRQARSLMRELYGQIIRREVPGGLGQGAPVPVVETDIASAQMIKYASNAFLATRVSFINEIAGLCERVGADIREVARGMGYDARIGRSYLEAGLGFGGPCLEKDLRALLRISEDNHYEARLLRAVLERNDQQLREVVAKIKQVTGYLLYRRVLTVFGLSFKPGTNDVRDSLAIRLIGELERAGAVVRGHDPVAIPAARALFPDFTYVEDPYDAAADADAVVIATDWPDYRELDYARLHQRMARPCVIDTRNMLEASAMVRLGFSYVGIGINSIA